MSANLPTPLLEAKGVAKHFGGVKALQDVSLTIKRGEIYGLIGPNGAGKTTFFNCMTGLYVPDGGGFNFAGTPLVADAPHRAAERGIARTFQNIRLFGNMTALENVMVGRHVRTRAGVLGAMFQNAATRAEEAAIRQRAIDLLHYVQRRFASVPSICCTTCALRSGPTIWPKIFPTATSAGWKSPGRWLPTPNCSAWMNRLPA